MNPMGILMKDVLYVLVTIAFFALMIWYVRGCEHLGAESEEEPRQ
jgi:hypothetical protein